MTKNILAIAILMALFFSCNEGSKSEKTEVPDAEASNSITGNSKNLLTGSWVQPNPINEKEVQGFKLKNDGSAESINMSTLVYKKWWSKNGNLTLVAESIGNSTSSIDTTVFKIVKNTGKELELQNGYNTEKYTKQ